MIILLTLTLTIMSSKICSAIYKTIDKDNQPSDLTSVHPITNAFPVVLLVSLAMSSHPTVSEAGDTLLPFA